MWEVLDYVARTYIQYNGLCLILEHPCVRCQMVEWNWAHVVRLCSQCSVTRRQEFECTSTYDTVSMLCSYHPSAVTSYRSLDLAQYLSVSLAFFGARHRDLVTVHKGRGRMSSDGEYQHTG